MGRVSLGIRYSSYPLKRQQQLNYGSDIRSGQERKSFKQYFSDPAFNSKREALKRKRTFYLSDTQLWRRDRSSPLPPFVELCAIRMRLRGLRETALWHNSSSLAVAIGFEAQLFMGSFQTFLGHEVFVRTRHVHGKYRSLSGGQNDKSAFASKPCLRK